VGTAPIHSIFFLTQTQKEKKNAKRYSCILKPGTGKSQPIFYVSYS